jgi:hypothetical protein
MKTYGVCRYSPIILDQLHTWAALTPEKEAAVPTGEEVGWAPEPVWTMWRRDVSLNFAGESNPGRGTRCLSLHRLNYRNLSPWATHTCERDSVFPVVWYTHWFGGGGHTEPVPSSRSLAWVSAKIGSFVSHCGQLPLNFECLIDRRVIWNVMLRPREQGLILINLYREGCMRSAQYQLGTWELSQHLLEDEGKPRNPVSHERLPVPWDVPALLHGLCTGCCAPFFELRESLCSFWASTWRTNGNNSLSRSNWQPSRRSRPTLCIVQCESCVLLRRSHLLSLSSRPLSDIPQTTSLS